MLSTKLSIVAIAARTASQKCLCGTRREWGNGIPNATGWSFGRGTNKSRFSSNISCSVAIQFLYSRIRYLTAKSRGTSAVSRAALSMTASNPLPHLHNEVKTYSAKAAFCKIQLAQLHTTTRRHHGNLATRQGQTGRSRTHQIKHRHPMRTSNNRGVF